MDPLRNIPRLSELSAHLLRLPTPDRGLFSTLTSISDIQAWTTTKADEYRQIALALLAIHNLAAPIHRLPTEVLERVFSYCWQDWNSLRLPHVCHLWRSILLHWAPFWADAVANCKLQEKRKVVRNELPFIDALFSRSTQHSHKIEPFFYDLPRSIAESLTPYVGSISWLGVAIGNNEHLKEGLWPALLSGMPNLGTLDIWVAVTEDDVEVYRTRSIFLDRRIDRWPKLPTLSRKTLPNLIRLTCPPQIVGQFGDVPLRRLRAKIVVTNPSRYPVTYAPQPVILGKREGLHLAPYSKRLKVLEIVSTSEPNSDAIFLDPLELPSLRYLRIEGDEDVVLKILSWLLLPQATLVRIATFNDCHFNGALRAIVSATDRVCFQQVEGRAQLLQSARYRTQCFAGNTERLRIDNLVCSSWTFIPMFGMDALVTQLELSVLESHLVFTGFDLHAFPHLVDLDVSGSDMKNVGLTLQPTLKPFMNRVRHGPALSAESPPLSPALTKLVITCRSPNDSDFPARTDTDSDTDFGTKVDNLFHAECSVLQQALAHRASRGTRLTYLAIHVPPATPNNSSGAAADKAGAEELEATAQRQEAGGKEDAGHRRSDDDPEGSSNKTAHTEPADSNAFWPSPTVRRSALQSLRELVDGQVILTLLDSAGNEISVEEA